MINLLDYILDLFRDAQAFVANPDQALGGGDPVTDLQ
jgi:hypothetical protein